jgi:hypothetical protein
MDEKLLITKLDAGKRQLETAVILYFNYGDPVSIHTLAAAAYAVLRDLNQKRGGELMLKDMWQLLEAPLAKEFKRYSNQPDNFFKHADNDPDGTQELDPRWSQGLLFEAARKYCELTGEMPPILSLFLIWFSTQHPEIFADQAEIKIALQKIPAPVVKERRQFFTDFLAQATSPFGLSILGATMQKG